MVPKSDQDLETFEYVFFHVKRDSVDVIKIDYSDLSVVGKEQISQDGSGQSL